MGGWVDCRMENLPSFFIARIFIPAWRDAGTRPAADFRIPLRGMITKQ